MGLSVLVAASFACGQDTDPPMSSPQADAQPIREKVFAVGPGVTAPELLSSALAPAPLEKCRKNVYGKVVLSVIVDAKGQPRNVMFLEPLGTELDRFALQMLSADRFKPGISDGAPVAVALSVEVEMEACVIRKKDENGRKTDWLRLMSEPTQHFGRLRIAPKEAAFASDDTLRKDSISDPIEYRQGGAISAPVLLNYVSAEFTDAARTARYQGTCMLSLIVDRNGMPASISVMQRLDYGLTENAIKSVEKFRFKPAMKDGEPVTVRVPIEVSFHLY